MKKRLAITVLLLWGALPVAAQEISGSLRITLDGSKQGGGLYAVPESVLPQPDNTSQQNLELSWQKGGFNATATLRNRVVEKEKPRQDGFFNELYLDTRLAGQDITIGRKIVGWGVGFGFRPLDVLQQENRRELYKNTLRGIDLFAWEKFFSASALSLVWSNPGRGRNAANPAKDESLALKYYGNLDAGDLHLVARLSRREKLQLGAGIASVPGESLEWHASLLWQRDYFRRVNRLAEAGSAVPLSTDDPFISQRYHNGLRAIAGAGWTHASGWGLLAETWYDQTAYGKDQWHALDALTRAQRRLLDSGQAPPAAVFGNIAYNRQAFLASNLRQWNALIRVSRQGHGVEPVFEFLYTPEDRGWVATALIGYALDRQRLEAGLRAFGGASDSAYARLPEDLAFYLSWRGSF